MGHVCVLESHAEHMLIYASRWIRLILTRELPFPLALQLWDGIFADDPSMALIDWVVLAMVMLIRNERELLLRRLDVAE